MTNMTHEKKVQQLHTVIAQALGSSPYSRDYHDQYYTQKQSYGYAMTDKNPEGIGHTVGGYIRQHSMSDKLRLVLNISLPTHISVRTMHHEIRHIHQQNEFKRHKIEGTPNGVSATDFLAQILLSEIDARNAEQEGPLLGFVQDLQQGKMDSIDRYKQYANNFSDEFKVYAAHALHDPNVLQQPVNKTVDHIGYQMMCQPDTSSVLDLSAARTGTAKNFVAQQGFQNNPYVEFYMGHSLSLYQECQEWWQENSGPVEQIFGNGADRDALRNEFGVNDFMFKSVNDFLNSSSQASRRTRPDMQEPTLERMSKAFTNNKDDVFLTLPQWQESLGAKDNAEFIGRLMISSPHRHTYEKFVADNKKAGLV